MDDPGYFFKIPVFCIFPLVTFLSENLSFLFESKNTVCYNLGINSNTLGELLAWPRNTDTAAVIKKR